MSWNIGSTEECIHEIGLGYNGLKEYFSDIKSIDKSDVEIGESKTLGLDILI